MALVASSISGAGYQLSNNEEKETGGGFEFTRRKKWPHLLLHELVGSALFCVKPVPPSRASIGSADGTGTSQVMGWKVLYVSPSVGDMLGQKSSDLEGRDFLDCVYSNDQPQIIAMFNTLLAPHLTHHQSNSSSNSSTNNSGSTPLTSSTTSSKSQTTYVRMLTDVPPSRPSSSTGMRQDRADEPRTVVWEIRAHATGVEGGDLSASGGFGLGGGGTMVPQSQDEGEMKGKAIWLMGRKVAEGNGEEGNGQNLDAFLELKLENEKLREELRELHVDFDEDDYQSTRPSYLDALPLKSNYDLPPSSEDSDAESSTSSSPASSPAFAQQPIKPPKVGRPPKDKEQRERKRPKKSANPNGPRAGGAGEGEGMHVCVTCGRTDSPEWRKGPLGPKTLCNACGLRWAKRNSTAPTRKEKKAAVAGK